MGTLGNQIQKGGMLEEKGGININSLKITNEPNSVQPVHVSLGWDVGS